MNTKILIAITAVVSFVTFTVYESVIMAWLPPLIIGLFLLIKPKNNDDNKFAGILVLKPLLIILFWVWLALGPKLSGVYAYSVFIPDLVLTLAIVYYFRSLLKDELLLMFFLGDLTRWLCLLIELLIPDSYPDTSLVLQSYIFIFFLLIFPSLYAVYGFMEVRSTSNSQSTTD